VLADAKGVVYDAVIQGRRLSLPEPRWESIVIWPKFAYVENVEGVDRNRHALGRAAIGPFHRGNWADWVEDAQ